MVRKKTQIYIVEGTNWKCKISYDKSNNFSQEDELVEVATRCFEHMFGIYPHLDQVDIFELRDLNGLDYFKNLEEDDIPDPSFGILTKIYKKEDSKDSNNHYYIMSKFIFENASNPEAVLLAEELEKEVQKKNPDFYDSLEDMMKDSKILKAGDMKDV